MELAEVKHSNQNVSPKFLQITEIIFLKEYGHKSVGGNSTGGAPSEDLVMNYWEVKAGGPH